MLTEFARCYKMRTGKIYDVAKMHIRRVLLILGCVISTNYSPRCLAHIINLATQALISTQSKSKYFSPHDDQDGDNLDAMSDGAERDEVGLIRAICVKVRLTYNFFCSFVTNILFRLDLHHSGKRCSKRRRLSLNVSPYYDFLST